MGIAQKYHPQQAKLGHKRTIKLGHKLGQAKLDKAANLRKKDSFQRKTGWKQGSPSKSEEWLISSFYTEWTSKAK